MADSICKHSGETCEFVQLIEKYVQNPQVREDGCVTGFIDSPETFRKFSEDLRECGITFSVRTSVGTNSKLHFSIRTNNFLIHFDGSPFSIERTTHYQCEYGTKYFSSKMNTSKEGKRSSKKRVYQSRKKSCPAKMVVKRLKVFPDYKVESDVWRKKQEALKKLKVDLKGKLVSPLERFMILISSADSHNHPMKKTTVIRPILVNYISDLSAKGFHSITEVKKLLYEFVEKMFENSNEKPSPDNESYYPTYQTVYKYLSKSRKKTHLQDCQEDNSKKLAAVEGSTQLFVSTSSDAEPVMLQTSQETMDTSENQVLLLYPGNEENNMQSLPVSVFFIQDPTNEEAVVSNQEICDETYSVSNLYNVNDNLESVHQHSSLETTALTFSSVVLSDTVIENTRLEECSEKTRETFEELLDQIRGAVPSLKTQQLQLGINTLRELQALFAQH